MAPVDFYLISTMSNYKVIFELSCIKNFEIESTQIYADEVRKLALSVLSQMLFIDKTGYFLYFYLRDDVSMFFNSQIDHCLKTLYAQESIEKVFVDITLLLDCLINYLIDERSISETMVKDRLP